MSISALQNIEKYVGDYFPFSMDFSALLDADETISGTPTVTSIMRGGESSDLTIDNISVSGQSVVFWIDGGTERKTYHVIVSIITSNSKEIVGVGILKVVGV